MFAFKFTARLVAIRFSFLNRTRFQSNAIYWNVEGNKRIGLAK